MFSIRLMGDYKVAGKDIARGQKQVNKWCLNNINLKVPDKARFPHAIELVSSPHIPNTQPSHFLCLFYLSRKKKKKGHREDYHA